MNWPCINPLPSSIICTITAPAASTEYFTGTGRPAFPAKTATIFPASCTPVGGKTAAFALPLIQQLSKRSGKPPGRRVRALILSPTRELAAQIHENIRAYARGLHLSTAVIFGGVGYASHFKELAGGLDILVATPGRLIDHLERWTVSLDGVETLILDEADHMLDMGFAPALKKIVSNGKFLLILF